MTDTHPTHGDGRTVTCGYGRSPVERGPTPGAEGNLLPGENRVTADHWGRRDRGGGPAGVSVAGTDGAAIAGDPEQSSDLPTHPAVNGGRDGVGGGHANSPYATTVASPGGSSPPSHHLLPVTGSGVPAALANHPCARIHGRRRAVGGSEGPPERVDRGNHDVGDSDAGRGR